MKLEIDRPPFLWINSSSSYALLLRYQYKQGGQKTGQFTVAVRPPSPRQTNLNYTGLLVIPL